MPSLASRLRNSFTKSHDGLDRTKSKSKNGTGSVTLDRIKKTVAIEDSDENVTVGSWIKSRGQREEGNTESSHDVFLQKTMALEASQELHLSTSDIHLSDPEKSIASSIRSGFRSTPHIPKIIRISASSLGDSTGDITDDEKTDKVTPPSIVHTIQEVDLTADCKNANESVPETSESNEIETEQVKQPESLVTESDTSSFPFLGFLWEVFEESKNKAIAIARSVTVEPTQSPFPLNEDPSTHILPIVMENSIANLEVNATLVLDSLNDACIANETKERSHPLWIAFLLVLMLIVVLVQLGLQSLLNLGNIAVLEYHKRKEMTRKLVEEFSQWQDDMITSQQQQYEDRNE